MPIIIHVAHMSTRQHKNTKDLEKTLSFRISRELWIRIGDVARRIGTSTQAFCTDAVERHLTAVAKEGYANDQVNGKSVRAKLPELRSKSKSQGE